MPPVLQQQTANINADLDQENLEADLLAEAQQLMGQEVPSQDDTSLQFNITAPSSEEFTEQAFDAEVTQTETKTDRTIQEVEQPAECINITRKGRHIYRLIGFSGEGLDMKTIYQCECGKRIDN